LSFYHWAKPLEFEDIVRADLINRLETAFRQRYSNISIRPFGSYASGLYLPTADVDLVLLSNTFIRTGVRTFGEKRGQIYAFSAFVKNTNIAVPNSIECIAGARVPILKFVDKLTGLRVDLSFDNDSGLIANETFKKWKAQYPAMPIILSVIKQFLLIRGLNEVPTGGLGGFSITCLVTSLLQHTPQGHLQPNLGNILMDFFNFYGKQYRYETQGIRMNPPGYFNKVYFGNPDRLTIEDPNNQDNDISGGTKEINLILRTFSRAHTTLQSRIEQLAFYEDHRSSILGPIIAANFDEYIEQRLQLQNVFMTEARFARYRTPPPPPPGPHPEDGASPPPLPPGPPPGPSSSSAQLRQPIQPTQKASQNEKREKAKSAGTRSEAEDISSDEPSGGTKSTKSRKGEVRRVVCQERAARLKRLRPELKKVPNTLSARQARRYAGYETNEEMEKDLDAREKELKDQVESEEAWKMVMDDA
jgi:non-canonical poly(A) RNA polymerase PAPD5/7